jgi:hypothetical protein
MIRAADLVKKMGKEKFVEFVAKNRPRTETMGDRENRVRWGKGRTVMAYCRHGNLVINNYEATGLCKACVSETPVTKLKDFREHFNIGLGGFVTSRSDRDRSAKKAGLVCVGDDRI